jgi:hypothetical protein
MGAKEAIDAPLAGEIASSEPILFRGTGDALTKTVYAGISLPVGPALQPQPA